MSEIYSNPQQRAHAWLQQQGVSVDRLTPLSGYTNHVFLVEQSASVWPNRSVLRFADFSRSADLCPLAHQFDAVLRRHVEAAELGLAPEVMVADRDAGAMWLQYAGEMKPLGSGDFAELRGMLVDLYESELEWGVGESFSLEGWLACVGQQICSDTDDFFSSFPFLGGCCKSKIHPNPPLQKEGVFQYNQLIVGRPPPLAKGERGGFKASTTSPAKGEGGSGVFSSASFLEESIERLLQQAGQRGYFDYTLVPIHGDLNPGNLLHDGQRWWLIDWDFSGMQVREWDLAGLIVEHGWRIEQALVFVPEVARADIKWFCSCFAVFSWYWHQQRGSDQQVIARKIETMQYWITLKG